MNYRIIVPAHCAVRTLTLALSLFELGQMSARAQDASSAEASTTPPYSYFQYATLTGSTNTISAALLPVVTATGATVLENVTLQFGFNSSGQLIVSNLEAAPAPPPVVTGFKAGEYGGPSTIDDNMLITISGPGLTIGGATEWTLTTPSGSWGGTYPATATWYDGPLTSNPIYKRISAAGITSTAWSYGVGGVAWFGDWEYDSLLGFAQVGNSLTILSFTDGSGKDHNLPVAQVTYMRKQ